MSDDVDESSLPILSVIRYTGPDYDEVFVSLRDGESWSGSNDGEDLWNIQSERHPDGDGPDIDVVTDDEGRVVAVILRDATEAHPSLLALAVEKKT